MKSHICEIEIDNLLPTEIKNALVHIDLYYGEIQILSNSQLKTSIIYSMLILLYIKIIEFLVFWYFKELILFCSPFFF